MATATLCFVQLRISSLFQKKRRVSISLTNRQQVQTRLNSLQTRLKSPMCQIKMSANSMKKPDTHITAQKRSQGSHDRNEVQYNGLKNQGATCYLNAVLQSLFMTREFREAVGHEAPGDCGEENLLLQLQKLFTKLSENAATTEGITWSLGIRNVYEQQDAVEYYRKILKAVGTRASKVFEGEMNNITKCGQCGNETTETSTFISILLSIDAGNDKYDMGKSLKTFFEHSKLEEDDWMYCERCDHKTETETWSKIDEYPTVLTLHLKRFDFDYIQMRYKKNECRLDVPLSLPKEDNWPIYDLYAVINHMGGYSSGHYDTIIRSFENGTWYCFDDYNVTRTSEASLENSNLPYMLMYRKSALNPDSIKTAELNPDSIKTAALNPDSIKTAELNPDSIKTAELNPDSIKTAALNPDSIKTAALNPGSIHQPMRILLMGPSRAGKSTVGNIILGGNHFPSKSGLETVTKESMVKTVENVTVVDTPNLFSLDKSSWNEEMKKCVKLSDPGPNVILWVTPISKFSEQQQGCTKGPDVLKCSGRFRPITACEVAIVTFVLRRTVRERKDASQMLIDSARRFEYSQFVVFDDYSAGIHVH